MTRRISDVAACRASAWLSSPASPAGSILGAVLAEVRRRLFWGALPRFTTVAALLRLAAAFLPRGFFLPGEPPFADSRLMPAPTASFAGTVSALPLPRK